MSPKIGTMAYALSAAEVEISFACHGKEFLTLMLRPRSAIFRYIGEAEAWASKPGKRQERSRMGAS